MRFGIVGDPVDHSRSPAMHNAGFAAIGINATYETVPTPADSFQGVVERLRSHDLVGVNVTMPHKANAYRAVDVRSALAERTGAVNTIVFRDGSLFGTNTDVAGVRHALKTTAVPDDAPLLVLGAGGAAAATVIAGDGRPLFVSARRPNAAEELLTRTASVGMVVSWGEGVAGAVVINATPLGMHGELVPEGPLATCSAFIDMTYGSGPSPALISSRALGLPTADGLDMLVGQAVEAFTIFTGKPAPVAVLKAAARDHG